MFEAGQSQVVEVSAAPQFASRAPARARVLVIDDEPCMGKCIKRTLRGHEVTWLSESTEAVRLLTQGPVPDLVLCDLMMPGCTGMELFSQLQSERPEVLEHFVFMSGGGFGPEAEAFVDAHPELPFIGKPFVSGQLEALAEAAAARRAG